MLADALNDKGNITATSVKARLAAIQGEPDSKDEREALTSCAVLMDTASKMSRAVKKEQEALDGQVLAHYATLTEDEIKGLVVKGKWIASVQSAIIGEVQRLTQALAARVQELEERYADSLPELADEVEKFDARVANHLQKMGVDWV